MLKKNLKYSDLPIFITPNAFTGDMNLIRDLSSIRQCLKNIIMTNNGERSFDYLFGGNVYSYLFENLTYEAIIALQAKLASNIRTYEPRVELNDITITEDAENNLINITIDFGIPDLGVKDLLTVALTRTR